MPQNQKTDFYEIGELPDLTEQQMRFVEEYLKTGDAIASYRAAYNAENYGQNALSVAASRTLHHAKISLWVAAGRMARLGKASVSHDEHLRELERLREYALRTGNIGAAVNAEVSRGKAAGHYVEKHADVSAALDPVQTLKEIAKDSPELAASLAKQHDIPWTADEGATKHWMWKEWQRTGLPEVLQKQFAPKPDITVSELAHIVSQLHTVISFDQETWDKQTKNIKRHFRDIWGRNQALIAILKHPMAIPILITYTMGVRVTAPERRERLHTTWERGHSHARQHGGYQSNH